MSYVFHAGIGCLVPVELQVTAVDAAGLEGALATQLHGEISVDRVWLLCNRGVMTVIDVEVSVSVELDGDDARVQATVRNDGSNLHECIAEALTHEYLSRNVALDQIALASELARALES